MKRIVLFVITFVTLHMSSAQQRSKELSEKKMGAYLMVYFKDDTHGLYFALSKDGYSFTDVNQGQPVISGDTIAEQKGIRDPYMYRNPVDGMYYLALTDLHIFGQKAGYRATQWERDGDRYGWGNNRGLVLMRSSDLIHWSHSVLRVDKAFPDLDSIGCVWAPEMIYDPVRQKTMIYFSMRWGNGKTKVYYAYMNKAFTAMETHPELLFQYPGDKPYIDADITRVNDRYYMLYCSHDGTAGIKKAVSDAPNKGYVYDPTWVDNEKGGCEAPTVYKLIGEKKWILVYDIYSTKPHNFGFMETTDFIRFTPLGRFNEGVMKATNFAVPKHPAIIQVTAKEAERIARNWGLNSRFK